MKHFIILLNNVCENNAKRGKVLILYLSIMYNLFSCICIFFGFLLEFIITTKGENK